MYAFPSPTLDIIFLHGLGGTSRGTWSWERDPLNFWPPWLADDSELSRARILTFGYNAAITGQYTSLNILDFAKDLLFRMKTYSGDYQQDSAPIGEVCFHYVSRSVNTNRDHSSVSNYLRSTFDGRPSRQKGISTMATILEPITNRTLGIYHRQGRPAVCEYYCACLSDGLPSYAAQRLSICSDSQ